MLTAAVAIYIVLVITVDVCVFLFIGRWKITNLFSPLRFLGAQASGQCDAQRQKRKPSGWQLFWVTEALRKPEL